MTPLIPFLPHARSRICGANPSGNDLTPSQGRTDRSSSES